MTSRILKEKKSIGNVRYAKGRSNLSNIEEKSIPYVTCPVCRRAIMMRGKPQTLEQWKVSLIVHLVLSPQHRLMKDHEVESIVNDYISEIA